MNYFNQIQHLKRSNIHYFCMQNSQEVWRHQKAQATRIKEINIAKLPTQNNNQQTKQRANKEKAKASTMIAKTQPWHRPPLKDFSSSNNSQTFQTCDSERLSNISEDNICCVCKKLSLDAMHLLYTIEFVTWGQCDRCNHWTHPRTALKSRSWQFLLTSWRKLVSKC